MPIPHEEWRGYFAASPTPFDKHGKLDSGALRAVLTWFIGEKPHGMVVNGTTGEWFSQTLYERKLVLDVARERVPETMPLLVGISSIRPEESVQLGLHASAAGADGVLLTLPPARRLTEAEIFDFYAAAADRIPLPILIYNVPSAAGYDLPPSLILKLQDIEGVVGVKDNTPSKSARLDTLRLLGNERALFSDVLEPESFEVMVAENVGRGQIGAGMPLGKLLSQAFELTWSGQLEEARDIVRRFTEFKKDILKVLQPGQAWHAQMKALMHASGIDAGYPRAPMSTVRDDTDMLNRLREIVKQYATPLPR